MSEPELSRSEKLLWEAIRYGLIVVILLALAWLLRPKTVWNDAELSGKTMGTFYSVKLSGLPAAFDAAPLERLVQEELDRIDQAMSTYKEDSDVCRFNVSESTDWFPVSEETAQVVELAGNISRETEGAFDITVGPLVRLWGFGAGAERRTEPPTLEEIEAARQVVGWKYLQARTVPANISDKDIVAGMLPPALKKEVPGLQIDLSAIAKGYAVDRVAAVLEKHGLTNYMIEVGGEVRCHGSKQDKLPWVIGIEAPQIELPYADPLVHTKIRLGDRSLATSGDYRNYVEIAGVRYSHIIDPRTGMPTEKLAPGEPAPEERLGSVSIIVPDCARADALATAMFVLGEKEGLPLAERNRWAALFLFRSKKDDAPFRSLRSSAFDPETPNISIKKQDANGSP